MKVEMRFSNQLLKFGLKKGLYAFTFLLAMLIILLSVASLSKFYSQSSILSTYKFGIYGDVHNKRMEDRVDEIMHTVMNKLVEEIEHLKELTRDSGADQSELKHERLKHTSFLIEMLGLVGSAKSVLPSERRHAPHGESLGRNAHPLSKSGQPYDEMIEYFLVEEIRKYARIKPSRLGKQNFMGANGTFTSIGHACFAMKEELEEYMDYDVGDFCKDDWRQAQRLMVHGCDPLPRRRCFSRAPKLYAKPFPINESMWKLPDDRNVRWSQYRCKNFACLAKNATKKGFFKSDFLIKEVLQLKPGEIRIGLDFSVGTGTFAARMREFNVTIVSATINLGAPFNEMIALRGLVPIYLTINQRLPFFDNTLDIIHTTSFFCAKEDLGDYLEAFKILRYKKHKWVIVPKMDKDGEEVFFSAVLEKPPRPF
uniref:Methyltransferase type 11 domain-containing protein n=1 Tax=Ananas comosus var. bracteatus TaxID=296719 RepID=A0A6V7QUU8_ANACO